MEEEGKILIISAPSGAGKTTIVDKILEMDTDFVSSISFTTREPRGNEQDGVDYFFRTEAEIGKMIDKGEMLEVAEVYGHLYGTSRNFVQRMTNAGKHVIFNIDWQGARVVRKRARVDVISIFVLPPSMKELKRRLEQRGQDSPEEIEKRLENAEIEISHKGEYSSVVVNDDIDLAVSEIINLVKE